MRYYKATEDGVDYDRVASVRKARRLILAHWRWSRAHVCFPLKYRR